MIKIPCIIQKNRIAIGKTKLQNFRQIPLIHIVWILPSTRSLINGILKLMPRRRLMVSAPTSGSNILALLVNPVRFREKGEGEKGKRGRKREKRKIAW